MRTICLIKLPYPVASLIKTGNFKPEPLPEGPGVIELTPAQSVSRFLKPEYDVELIPDEWSTNYYAIVRTKV